jgi:hypothetical protein
MTLQHLQAELDRLADLAQRVRASGSIAPSHCWIEEYVVKRGERSYLYQRVASDRPQFGKSGQSRTLHLGKAGSPNHRDWQLRMQRRDALMEVERRAAIVQELIDLEQHNPIHVPS